MLRRRKLLVGRTTVGEPARRQEARAVRRAVPRGFGYALPMITVWPPRGGIAGLCGFVCLSMGGCFGDPDPEESSGASDVAASTAALGDSGDATSTSASSTVAGADSSGGSSGGGGADNLLTNGSFETWAGGTPIAWTPTKGTTLVEVGDAFEGSASMEVHVGAYGEVRQRVDLPAPIPAGTVIAAQMAYRYVEGDTTAPGIDVHGIGADQQPVVIPAIVTPTFAPEGWTEGGGNVTTDREFIAIQVALVAGGVAPQVVQIDDVRVTIVD